MRRCLRRNRSRGRCVETLFVPVGPESLLLLKGDPPVITIRSLIIVLSAFLTFIAAGMAQSVAPPARVSEVTDEYFGTQVKDPYRWMEDLSARETTDWIRAQAKHTDEYLDRLPGRDEILKELEGLSNAGVTVSDIRSRGDVFFYTKRLPGEQDKKLYVRQAGAEHLLVDPEKFSTADNRESLDDWNISWDGKYVSFVLQAGGSEHGELRVVETATGKVLGERIDRPMYSAGEWLPDGKSFLYPRFAAVEPGAPATALYLNARVYKHVLGTNPSVDRPLFGSGVDKGIAISPELIPFVRTNPTWKYAFVSMSTATPNVEIYAAPLDTLDRAVVPWRKIATFDDQVTRFDLRGDDLYMLTYRQTPRYKIVHTSMSKPDISGAETIFFAGDAVVEGLAAQHDALYLQTLDGGSRRIYRVSYGTKKAEPLKLPAGSASIAANESKNDGIYMTIDSWTRPPAHLKYNPATGTTVDTGIIPPIAIDMSGIEVVGAKARSWDGTMVPLVILHKKGIRLDGSNPTFEIGYGAYGFESTSPEFAVRYLPWLRRGGVLVFAGVRGGGEYGEEWHMGGFKQTKPNTWKDFIACGEYLIREKYTSPAHLAGMSYSAGGILIGRAITARPELFGAAIIGVGDTNTLRTETYSDGEANSAEYGTVKIESEFRALYEMDGFHHVVNGVRYPAVMLTHGFNDPRVAVWQSAKMAARLQAATTSGKPILLRIDYDAGHGSFGSSQKQRDQVQADTLAFLLEQIGQEPR